MVAADDPSIAGVITLAGPGVPGMEVARYQVQQPILRDPKMSDADREKAFAKQLEGALKDSLAAREQFPRNRSPPVRSPRTLPRAHHSGWHFQQIGESAFRSNLDPMA